jgi:hypothetical protein
MRERSGSNGIEVFVPCDKITSHISPEFIGILNRVFVDFLVVFQSVDVRGGMMIENFGMRKLFCFCSFENDLDIISHVLRVVRYDTWLLFLSAMFCKLFEMCCELNRG